MSRSAAPAYLDDEEARPRRPAGRPLPPGLKRRASHAYGDDFSDVRVHREGVPGAAPALGGAIGRDVFLDPMRVDTPVMEQVVLAHELAHVAQQSRADAGAWRDAQGVEADADLATRALWMGQPAALAAAPLRLARCMGPARPAGGAITPAHFRFQTVVPIRPGDGDPAGWQAAAVRGTMSKDVGGVPYGGTVCAFEVGVPLRSHAGTVSTLEAQTAAAAAANTAAYHVLSSGEPVTAATCIAFRREMQVLLGLTIPGARVSSIVTHTLPVSTFP